MKYPFTSIMLILLMSSIGKAQDVDFGRDIQPILNAKCIECHGGVKATGGFSFVYESQVVNGEGESGYTIVTPGDLADSEIVNRITSDDEGEMMPPPEAHPALSKQEVELIKKWIKEGANWNGHWAFVPPIKPLVPKSDFDSLANNDIDRFLFARLQREGLKPSAEEQPGRLLRRLSIGLTGLPPTLAELEEFEAAYSKNSQSAVEATVDELMERDAFGERWATMWLDLVRYADSAGLGLDQRRTIWPYRDWVVNAFNEDMPFDQFTVKQLAGDLLPNPTTSDFVATACQRNTQTNNEGGTDDEEFRTEAVIDRVNTTWQAWGSITFGCVQCHDHPYDPIRHHEYYQFMDFYNNSADSDLDNDAPLIKVPNDGSKNAETIRLREEILSLKQQIWEKGIQQRDKTQWVDVKELTASSAGTTNYAVEVIQGHAEFFTADTVATKTQTHLQIPSSNFDDQAVTALKLTVLPLDPDASLENPEWGFTITKLEAAQVAPDKTKLPIEFRWSVPDVAWLPDNPLGKISASGVNWGAHTRIHYARELILIPKLPITIEPNSIIELQIHCDRVSGGAHPLSIKRGHIASTTDQSWNSFADKNSDVYKWSQDASKALDRLNKIPGTQIPMMGTRPNQIRRPTNVFARGNPQNKEDRVSATIPESFLKYAALDGRTDRLDRTDMANWWIADSNPLTARVLVNRVWAQLLGVGIVPTIEDFGSSGDKPTHGELLDYLAVRFQKDHQWSMKAIIREMVLSHVFRQSEKVTSELVNRDPDNRLLARGPRLRLSAEAVRDQTLAFAGLLSPTVGGPPVRPPIPDGVWLPFVANDKWNSEMVGTDARYRRSIYIYMKRSIPFPSLATFDAPSREFCTPRRLTSNTPLQALVMLNDAVFVECAEAFGHRMKLEFSGTPNEKMGQAFRLVTCRDPDQVRMNELIQLYEKLKHDDPEEKNVWMVIAQVLLNLDDAMTY